MEVKEIDGSVLEGGGQILRMSMTFSALCGVAVKIIKIRAGRSRPGLAAQHLKGIQLIKDMCNGRLSGAELGSTEIEFLPGRIKGGEYQADTQTAGSSSLLLQIALPCALFADSPVTLQLKGGTNADMAPQIDYTTEIFRPNLERFGGTFDFTLHRRGYFPKGGGHVTANISPVRSLHSINMTLMGRPQALCGWSFAAGTLPIRLTYQMADGAKDALKSHLGNIAPNIECYKESEEVAKYNASGIILVCETSERCIIGGTGLGKPGTNSFETGAMAAKDIIDTLRVGACVDKYAQDQLIIFMALAEGTSNLRVGELTLHTKTAIYIAEQLTSVKFTITRDRDTNIISCNGLGLINKSFI